MLIIINDLGAVEDEIFQKRQHNEKMFRMRLKQKKIQELQQKLIDNNQNPVLF